MLVVLLSRISFILIFSQGIVAGHNQESNQHAALSDLFTDLIMNRFPNCEVIFVSDNYFQKFVVRWMENTLQPIHVINLQHNSHPMVRRISLSESESASGLARCSTIIVCCQYKSSCRTQYSPELFEMLLGTGIIRSTRRSFLFIQNETTDTFKPTAFFEKENAMTYSMPLMHVAKEILLELKSHITLIRKFVGTSPLLRDDNSPTYHLITFTPNWIPGGSPVLQLIWSKKRGFWEAKGKSGGLEIKYGNIRPGVVRVALPSFQLLPLINVDKDGTATGFNAKLMDLIAVKFNFQVKYFEVEDEGFGKHLKSKGSKVIKWTGVIGEVLQKNADIGMGHIVMTLERGDMGLQFSPPLDMHRGVIVCLTPPEIHSWTILFSPFDIYVWILLAVTLCCVLALNVFLQKLIKRCFKPRKRWGEGWFPRRTKVPVITLFTWMDCVGSIIQNSVSITFLTQRNGFRIFVASLLIFGFAISTFYGSVLIGKLSIFVHQASFDTFKDLVKNGKDWVLSPLVLEALENTENSDELKLLYGSFAIGNKKGHLSDLKEYDYVLETGRCAVVDQGHAAYVIHNNYTIYYPHRPNKPLLRMSKETILLGPSGWVMRADVDFILHEYLSKIFVTFRDFGFIDQTVKLYERQRDELQQSRWREGEESGVRSLEMESIQMVFYFWMGGLFISALSFLFELSSFTVKTVERKRK